jgi:lysophospholipase L1-like esterase
VGAARWAKRAAFAVFPAIVLFGGLEAWCQATGWPHIPPDAKLIHNEVYWVEDPNQNLEDIPHRETGGSFRVSTDQNGLRAPLHSEAKPAGAYRVMTLGCSTTFGWGVGDEESYPSRLEAILHEGGHKVEVINGGQPGHSSFQGRWLWERTLKNYNPDVVIFGYIVQDSRKVAYTDHQQAVLQQNADFLKSNLLHKSKAYLFAKSWFDKYRIKAKDEKHEVPRVPVEEYVENLRWFKEQIDAVGAKMVLFGFPLEREGYTKDHRAVLHAAADKLAVPIYDPQPEMERRSSQATLYFPQDRGHANAAGNEVIAQGMAQFLVTQKLVP